MHTAGTLRHSPVASFIFYFLCYGTFASTVCLPFIGFKYGTEQLSQQTGVLLAYGVTLPLLSTLSPLPFLHAPVYLSD